MLTEVMQYSVYTNTNKYCLVRNELYTQSRVDYTTFEAYRNI